MAIVRATIALADRPVAKIELKVRQDRHMRFSTERDQRSENAQVAALAKMYVVVR
ncbi:hypothetical protein [Bradyrhizobium brasilense]|uniref:Uncharacterized protein n=1 Tax=Bradyrhizobium brasilense TaxID=1419277 RepID=A0ABY8JXD9_9BRAD|nr:hypothetical protein [Bradyrhizobium brasilense]WFU68397.1 hypothetical protein QA636_34485 [Bradyrhizobium brasilense]